MILQAFRIQTFKNTLKTLSQKSRAFPQSDDGESVSHSYDQKPAGYPRSPPCPAQPLPRGLRRSSAGPSPKAERQPSGSSQEQTDGGQ